MLLEKLKHSLNSKNVLLNYHSPGCSPDGEWTVEPIIERTGNKELDGLIKKSKSPGCKSKTDSFKEIAETVVVYRYDKKLDDTIPELKVIFNSNTDQSVKKEMTVKSGDKLTLIPMDFDEKPYCHFDGWSESPENIKIDENYTITHDVELKAIWSPNLYKTKIYFVDDNGETIDSAERELAFGKTTLKLPQIPGFDSPESTTFEITNEMILNKKPIEFKVKCQKKTGTLQVGDNLSIFNMSGEKLQPFISLSDDDRMIIAFDDVDDLQRVKIAEYQQHHAQSVSFNCKIDEIKKITTVYVRSDFHKPFELGKRTAYNHCSHIDFSNILGFGDYTLSFPELHMDGDDLICEYTMKEKTVKVIWRVDNIIIHGEDIIVNEIPKPPKDPVKNPNGDTVYVFTGWEPKIGPVNNQTTYNACFVSGDAYKMVYKMLRENKSKSTIEKMLGLNKDLSETIFKRLEADGIIVVKNKKYCLKKDIKTEEKTD